MRFQPTERFPEIVIVQSEPREDERGFLARTYCELEFGGAGLNTKWVQQNHTLTKGVGTVRGLHWQSSPFAEIKLVRCIIGVVYDVVVDIRPESPSFGCFASIELSAENRNGIYIPDGFAHGFQCLTKECELLYLMSEFYNPDFQKGIFPNDPSLNLTWPTDVRNLSKRDKDHPFLNDLRL